MSKNSLSFLTSYFLIIPAITSLPPPSADFSLSGRTPPNKSKRSDIKYFLTIYFLTKTTQKCANFIDVLLGRCGHKSARRSCMGHFFSYCVRLVYFLRKSTEFHVKRTFCQIILFHFLLIIFSEFLRSLHFRPLPPISV